MATAHGVSGINLLPKDSFDFSIAGKVLKWITTAGRVLVVLTEFVVLLAFASRFYFDKKLSDLGEVTQQKLIQISAYEEVEAQMRKVLDKQKPVKNVESGGLGFVSTIDYLSSIMPVGVVLDTLTLDKTNLVMYGSAQSEYGFAQLISGIKKMPDVAKINLKDTNYEQTTGGVKFNIQINFK